MADRRSLIEYDEPLPPSRTLLIGGLLGMAIGLLAATSYNRAAEETQLAGLGRRRVQLVELFTLGLAVLAVIRQTAELARVSDDGKGR
jgi:uncharacterized membrane protein